MAGNTTPAVFGARVPNLNTQLHYFTSESYTLWATLLAPVQLQGRFSRPKYFLHFLDLIFIFNNCLSLAISPEYVDTTLRRRIVDWVLFQYQPDRLKACPLTIHALLHIPDDILNAGPMWTYWNYVTERYVGFLVRSSKSRRNPYASFARRLREIAQNTAIKIRFHLREELDLSGVTKRTRWVTGSQIVRDPDIRVLHPRAEGPMTQATSKAAKEHLMRTYQLSADEALNCLPSSIIHWGKISFLNGGDKICGAELVSSNGNITHDASFIKAGSSKLN
ncbi:hypothetical protein GGX14DRAFT_575614 [Mycena pura]|uniref:DUF4218 domain-containing protein n=1 Tax=Mycena pura TaxID=153505 RepID=A0AAD6UVT3_9AGAR|nr:hypothetical protein GGX14DRAFT_575614 [Mycena pura]